MPSGILAVLFTLYIADHSFIQYNNNCLRLRYDETLRLGGYAKEILFGCYPLMICDDYELLLNMRRRLRIAIIKVLFII